MAKKKTEGQVIIDEIKTEANEKEIAWFKKNVKVAIKAIKRAEASMETTEAILKDNKITVEKYKAELHRLSKMSAKKYCEEHPVIRILNPSKRPNN